MSCQSSDQQLTDQQIGAEHLQNLLLDIKPKARYLSQMHVQEYIDSIYMEIINGDTQIPKESTNYNFQSKQKNDFEQQLRKRVRQHAQNQKRYLENKLNHIDRSINQLNQNQRSSDNKHRHSISYGSQPQKQEWRKQIKERGKNIERKKQEIEQAKKKKQEETKQIGERVKKQQEQAKKKQLLQHMKLIQQRTKKRQQQVKSANQRYKQLTKNKSLHQKITDSYHKRQSSILDQRKKKLAEIRNLHRPIDSSQIIEHEQKFLELKKQKEQMRQREKRMNQSRSNSYQPFYRSVFYKKALEDSRVDQQNVQMIKKQKVKQFSQHVKQCFIPEVDQKKRQQLEDYIQKQRKKLQHKSQRDKQLLYQSKNKGMQYLQLVKKLPKKRRDGSEVQKIASQTDRREYKNYLTHSMEEGEESGKKRIVKPWNKILTSNNDKQSKALMLQIESEKREEELKRREQQIRLLKQGNSEDIDEEYFQMIKAKLDLLQTPISKSVNATHTHAQNGK